MATPDPDPTSGPSGTRPRPLPADTVALRYLPTKRERFDTEPGADPCGSYTVTDSATSERQIETSVTGKLSPEEENIEGGDRLSHEWYWRGTQYIANRLSPDHLESVTRVILVTRKIEAGNFPPIWVVNNRTPHEREQICKDLIQALTFEFEIKVYDNCYVKELGHGINRLSLPGETSAEQLFERRSNGGKFLNPIESKTFFIGPDKEGSLTVIHKYGKDWPTEETISLKQKEAELESKYSNSDLALRELTLQSIGEYVQLVSGASGNGKAPSK
ncbi:hypothetical protein N7466_003191 [Penicillium verhagenii]|uniref:uncharacterized protein n=1 Tax=Penicillium verhagenii TaxID=1562060 RepID=UPI00254511CA|nr:uncharacterized protein N7466_003191 [Penicillium verhagenii]KAJ5936741.1 hypothetical protein N7466_003191 [Penicillium verhagenii]